jgi:hypothetical protein
MVALEHETSGEAATPLGEVGSGSTPPSPRCSTLLRRRVLTMAAYGSALWVWWLFLGVPTDSGVVFCWLWLATIAWNPHWPWRSHVRFARDWLPIVVLLLVYDISRGFADKGRAPHVMEMIQVDRWLAGGVLPTVWLQEHFFDPSRIHWWDLAASWIYLSHFVATLTVAVVLWLRSRPLWAAFMRRWFTVTALGLITYFLMPAAPPWWASQAGFIPDAVVRLSSRGWSAMGLSLAGKLLTAGQELANPVAAMPSLHTAFSLSVVAFFFRRVPRRWLPLLIAYPVAMGLTLVYSGEHYVADALAGVVCVGLAYALVNLGERWWAGHGVQVLAALARLRSSGRARHSAGERGGAEAPGGLGSARAYARRE